MRVENQTSDPVDYEQNGGDPLPEDREACPHGRLEPGGSREIPDPCGPPYDVWFRTIATKVPSVHVQIAGIRSPDAVVVLASLPVIVE